MDFYKLCDITLFYLTNLDKLNIYFSADENRLYLSIRNLISIQRIQGISGAARILKGGRFCVTASKGGLGCHPEKNLKNVLAINVSFFFSPFLLFLHCFLAGRGGWTTSYPLAAPLHVSVFIILYKKYQCHDK